MQAATQPAPDTSPLAIICGAGRLPITVAEAVQRQGRPVFLLPFRGWVDAAAVAPYPHRWIAVGQFGTAWRYAREAGCRDVVCIGGLLRPSIRNLRLDWVTVMLMPRLFRIWRGGDDHLLSGLSTLFEEKGFRIIGAHEVAPEILVPEGCLTRAQPSASDAADMALGFALLDSIGRFDIGQAAVVANGRVLAVEAAEGTDAMLARIATLRAAGRVDTPVGTGVLVKAAKPQQDRRLDLPTIGPTTVENIARAGLGGLGVRVGDVIVAEPQAMVAAADAAGVFVAGIAAGAGAGA